MYPRSSIATNRVFYLKSAILILHNATRQMNQELKNSKCLWRGLIPLDIGNPMISKQARTSIDRYDDASVKVVSCKNNVLKTGNRLNSSCVPWW